MRLVAIALVAVGLIGLGGQSAKAVSLNPNPVLVSAYHADVSVELMGSLLGLPDGGVVLSGALDANDVTLVFQATTERIAPDAFFPTMQGFLMAAHGPGGVLVNSAMGWIPGADDDGLANVSPASLVSPDGILAALFFEGGIAVGQSSNYFFVSFPELPIDGTSGVSFAYAVGQQDGYGTLIPGSVQVPEPAAGWLLLPLFALWAPLRRVA